MKIGICGDVHWNKYSSIVRKQGENYSYRLENLIESINWFESISKDCGLVVYLGDFFDKAVLEGEEITALSNIKWNNNYHYMLVGNHEMSVNDLSKSSAHIFNLIPKFRVIDKSCSLTDTDNLVLCFLPYVLEENRESLHSYFKNIPDRYKKIIFSHNDISGIQMGNFISKTGFSIDEIENQCELFINGHLHNGCNVTDKIINVGNITGQNFSEDAFAYNHKAIILDTETMKIEEIENPYALNFYKTDDVNKEFKSNAVLTVKCNVNDANRIKEEIKNNPNIVEYRLLLDTIDKVDCDMSMESLSINHLEEFQKYILSHFDNTESLKEELENLII